MESKKEVTSLQKINNTECIKVDNNLYIRQIEPGVIIMPYTLDNEGNPDKIGILDEISNHRPGGISNTLITGSQDDKDSNVLQTAIREMEEESGFKVTDIKRWNFLGTIFTSKLVTNPNPCFAVNITGLAAEDKKTDGSDEEKDSKFNLVSVDDALNIDDSLISALFIKTFKNIMLKTKNDE